MKVIIDGKEIEIDDFLEDEERFFDRLENDKDGEDDGQKN